MKENSNCDNVKVDVTKIVKYVCITGTAIVAIIFGCRLFHKK